MTGLRGLLLIALLTPAIDGLDPSLTKCSVGRRAFLVGNAAAAAGVIVGPKPSPTHAAEALRPEVADGGMANSKLTNFQEGVSGVVGGSVVSTSKVLVKHPLDTVSVRLQVAASNSVKVSDIASHPTPFHPIRVPPCHLPRDQQQQFRRIGLCSLPHEP